MMLLVGAALAGGLHTGIPVRGVQGVGAPSFQTARTGWSAAIDGGFVRVFVGETEEDGAEWYTRSLASIQVPPPPMDWDQVDAASGDGETLVVFRDGNVAVFVRATAGAGDVAERLRAAIVDGVARVQPKLVARGERWVLDGGEDLHTRFVGGRLLPFHAGEYTELPRELTVWDAYGRVTVLRP